MITKTELLRLELLGLIPVSLIAIIIYLSMTNSLALSIVKIAFITILCLFIAGLISFFIGALIALVIEHFTGKDIVSDKNRKIL